MDRKIGFFEKFFLGSIRRKLLTSFGFLVLLMVLLAVSTYYLNNELRTYTAEVREVSAPMDLMIEEVIGYDAMLTGNAHAALLHAMNGETDNVKAHEAVYDAVGIKLDNLLKKDYIDFLNKSSMPLDLKNKEKYLLSELDKSNIALVELETGAFSAMDRGDVNTAFGLIVSEKYDGYKATLSSLYTTLSQTQLGYTQSMRSRASAITNLMDWVNGVFAVLIIILGIILMFVVSSSISNPVKELQSAVIEISKGSFTKKINIKTHDELAQVGLALNNASTALAETEEKRKQIDKVKTEFLSITSHELRSPMTPMRAQLQMLLGGYFGKLNPKQKEAADIILRNTERLDKILMDFLEISRIEAARLKFSFVRTSLEKPIKRVVEEMDAYLPEKKVSIELRMGDLPEFEVDPDRAMQVLRNLINNAIKFVPDKGGKIIVSVQPKEDELLFTVKDNGVGIAQDNQRRIFEPFFQEEQTMYRKYAGTGLGLAICRGIIESQKGKIWFESVKGKGTTFYFTVPFVPVKEIAPIRVLFSERSMVEDKLKKLMVDYLGPLGSSEFAGLSKKDLTEKAVMDYVDELIDKGIVSNKRDEFKKSISLLFGNAKEPEKTSVKEQGEKDFVDVFLKNQGK